MSGYYRAMATNCFYRGSQAATLARALQRGIWRPLSSSPTPSDSGKLALVMGVANERSIAWACVLSFLHKGYDCIITYQDSQDAQDHARESETKHVAKMKKLVQSVPPNDAMARILGFLPCNVATDLPALFRDRIQPLLKDRNGSHRRIDAVLHSIAYSPEMDRPLLQSSSTAFLTAQHISAYSLIETVRECTTNNLLSSSAAITTLSYLGAIRSVSGYGSMGPAKASLESVVRTLAAEAGQIRVPQQPEQSLIVRVNAVSAGPIKTVSARGIANFSNLQQHVAQTAPLRRNVTAAEVAETVTWLSTAATGITGQTIYVDAGYSSVVPVTV